MQTSLRAIPYLVLLTALLAAERLPAQAGAWQLVSDRNGIQVYMQHGDRTPLKTFRGVTRFPEVAPSKASVRRFGDIARQICRMAM